jgi:hypothetical protein
LLLLLEHLCANDAGPGTAGDDSETTVDAADFLLYPPPEHTREPIGIS